MFISAFTNARHLSLTWVISIQDMPLHPTSLKSILITMTHLRLCLQEELILIFSPPKSCVCNSLVNLHAAGITKFILLDLINRKIVSEEYGTLNISLCILFQSHAISFLQRQKVGNLLKKSLENIFIGIFSEQECKRTVLGNKHFSRISFCKSNFSINPKKTFATKTSIY